LGLGPGSSSYIGELYDARLSGASDVAALPGGQTLLVAATNADLVGLVALDDARRPSSMQALASKSAPGCETLSSPSCLAISAQGELVALGTTGDDALYLFTLASSGQALSLVSRISAADCSSLGSLSNPCDLVFSPAGTSLFVLAYSSKTVFRFDRNAAGLFVAVAAAKSGSGGASGFAYPKRLALSSEGTLLAVIGSGTADGIALFDVSASGTLGYLGSALPTDALGDALPEKPLAAAFSPTGKAFALGAEDRLAFYSY
jgi:DNA-binding beta-propeller fold protein YncE